jgi:predicted O-methyltransferase YrrM/GNAT superfamily N-acetyltransferase
MAVMLSIEPCASVDQPGWLTLRAALWPHCTADEHRADATRYLAEMERYAQFVAYGPGREPIGFVEASVRSDYVNGAETSPVAFLEGIYVVPPARRQGVARALCDAVVAWARGKGLSELMSDALLGNGESHAMHAGIGFAETERVVYFRRVVATQAGSAMTAPILYDGVFARRPSALVSIQAETDRLGFTMASEPKTGALLATLAAMKPGGRLLELGTGTGLGTAWLLSGMDAGARLDTVDTDVQVVAVARQALGHDARVTFHVEDGATFIERARPDAFDVIYADAWPGKFTHLTEALALLRPGGLYLIDDLLPQANWPDGHDAKVRALVADLEGRSGFRTVRVGWASGLMLVVRDG